MLKLSKLITMENFAENSLKDGHPFGWTSTKKLCLLLFTSMSFFISCLIEDSFDFKLIELYSTNTKSTLKIVLKDPKNHAQFYALNTI